MDKSCPTGEHNFQAFTTKNVHATTETATGQSSVLQTESVLFCTRCGETRQLSMVEDIPAPAPPEVANPFHSNPVPSNPGDIDNG
jgi:hypothetical protein